MGLDSQDRKGKHDHKDPIRADHHNAPRRFAE